MRDIAEELHAWHAAGKPYAVASVVGVKGSAPRELGAALAVDAEGAAVGSVSGGCVEGAVYELCVESLRHGRPVLETFGYSDDDAFAVGLTCGGELEVFIQPVFPDREPGVGAALKAVSAGEPIALARVIAGPPDLVGHATAWSATGAIGSGLDRVVARHARAMIESGTTGTITVGTEGEGQDCGEAVTVFIESFGTAPRMLIFGAIDFAAALVRVGKYLGYHVTVCDARPVFATRSRFPEADDVVVAWPHRYLETARVDARTVVAVLTHDAKFDVPLLVKALRLPIAYVGAMGSRRTCAQRADRLREAGLSAAEIANLHAPIGLDLGARTAEETALAIAAEIVAVRHGGTGRALGDVETAIHRGPEARHAAVHHGEIRTVPRDRLAVP